jgi:prepilin-type N-terminal cleavage/methylation domain-containing protein
VKNLRNKNQKGFTLIELLVVIAIIGLLASVVLLALNSARSKSRDAKRLADMRQLSTALELFYNDMGGYPTTTARLEPTYVGKVPTAPTPPDGTTCNASNNAYTYTAGTNTYAGTDGVNVASSYSYSFCLGAQTGGYGAGTRTASPEGIK